MPTIVHAGPLYLRRIKATAVAATGNGTVPSFANDGIPKDAAIVIDLSIDDGGRSKSKSSNSISVTLDWQSPRSDTPFVTTNLLAAAMGFVDDNRERR